jgi:putative ABC transport system permease protein
MAAPRTTLSGFAAHSRAFAFCETGNIAMPDLRHAFRVLAKSPALSVIAILTLAIGIGVNTAVFTVANAVLLQPLPYTQPDRLVMISGDDTPGDPGTLSYPYFNVITQRTRTVNVAACVFENFNLTRHGDPEQIQAARANWNFFAILGVHPFAGRTFLPEEDKPGASQVVVLSYPFAERLFGKAETAVGQNITLDAGDYSVIGVLPRNFEFSLYGPRRDIWAPRPFDFSLVTPARIAVGGPYFNLIGRLRDGVSRSQATTELIALYHDYAKDHPGNFDATFGLKIHASNLQDELVSGIRPTLLILWAAVALVLLIACANVASLLLSRALGRRKEFAVRIALGASRYTVIRQLLTESLLIAMLSGILGIALAGAGTRVLTALNQDNLHNADLSINSQVLLFTLAISLLSGVLFGLAPSLQLSRRDLIGALRDEGRGLSGNRGGNRSRSALVIGQIALSTVLLVGSGLLLRSFMQLRNQSNGFDPSSTLTLRISLPKTRYVKPEDIITYYRRVVEQIRTVPGVVSSAVSTAWPVVATHITPMLFEGQPPVAQGKRPLVNILQISPDYFKVMRIPLLSGRSFTDHDDAQSAPVAIVNQLTVRRFWPHQNPIGKRVWVGTLPQPFEVVGVVGDTRNKGPAQPPLPELVLPFPQMTVRYLSLSLRTQSNPYGILSDVRHRLSTIDPDQPVTDVKTMEELVDSLSAGQKFTMFLIGTLSVSAFFLALVGIYGVIAYTVAQRTQELGIRMALGAARGDILRLVISRGIMLTLTGIAIGVAGSLALTKVMSSLLYQTSTYDPLAYIASALLFVAAALLASYLPARRATKIDPADALRTV